MPFQNDILAGASGQGGAYTIDQSCRFNLADSAYLNRTPGSDGNQETWTFSFWHKRGNFYSTGDPYIFAAEYDGSKPITTISIGRNDYLRLQNNSAGVTYDINLITTQVFRDFSAWYHIVIAMDTTQAVEANRTKIYVNGSQVTAFSTETYPTQDLVTGINVAGSHMIMKGDGYTSGYLAEVYLIDGTAYDADDFGETDEDTNQWKPIDASGLTFGTNGFYLKFQDSSDFGDDSSGEGNDYTSSGLVATDQMLDTPTNNFSTMNPLNVTTGGSPTFSEGNLQTVDASNGWGGSSTIEQSSGKWYAEFLVVSHTSSVQHVIGVDNDSAASAKGDEYPGRYSTGWGYYADNGKSVTGGTFSSYGDTYDDGDIIGIALDLDNDNLYFSKNNTWQNSGVPTSGATGTGALSITTAKSWAFAAGNAAGAPTTTWVANFGSDSSFVGNKTAQGNKDENDIGDFYYAVPSGFLALCTSNLPDPVITLPAENFNTILWSGTNPGAVAISPTGVGFQPDVVWAKTRNSNWGHQWTDVSRGTGKSMAPESDAMQVTNSTNGYISSFNSDGFTATPGGSNNAFYNVAGGTYVAWCWKFGGSPTSNTDGDIDSYVSVNSTAGMSLTRYEGLGAGGSTFGHGLSVAPTFVMIKGYTGASGANNWYVWVKGAYTAADYTLQWNTNGAQVAAGWNAGVIPTSSVVKVANSSAWNAASYDFIAWCMYDIEGFSKTGYYTGNGNVEGTFIYTGFRPAWVLIKQVAGTNDWFGPTDSKRVGYNPVGVNWLLVNTNQAENTGNDKPYDLVSNGFKLRKSTGYFNDVGIYIYMAFAEFPFKTANAR